MKLFKLLVAYTALMSSYVKAEINLLSHSIINDKDWGEVVHVRKQNSLIKDAALAASAAYNDRKLVALKSSPLRNQAGFEDREKLIKDGYEVTSFSATTPKDGDLPAGIVGYKEMGGGKTQIIVAFHGSESVEDFTQVNLRALKTKDSQLGIEGYIHGGFHDRYLQSREALFDVIEDTLNRHGKTAKDVDFVVTGHSLGGALATVAAADLKSHMAQDSRLNLVTFSSPRVVDHAGAESIEKLIGKNHITRIWRGKDPVPMVSLGTQFLGWLTGFKHVGQSVKLESTINKIALANHSLDTIKKDAWSDEQVEFDLNHVGYRTWFKNKVSNGLEKLGRFFGRA